MPQGEAAVVGLHWRVIGQAPLREKTLGARPGCRRGTPAIRSHSLPPASIRQLLAVLPYYPGLDADKPAKAASKRISAPGAQWTRQGSHAWLLRLSKKPRSPGSTTSVVTGSVVHIQRPGRDTACDAGQAYPPLGGAACLYCPKAYSVTQVQRVSAPTRTECMAGGLQGRPQCSTPQGLEERRKKASPH